MKKISLNKDNLKLKKLQLMKSKVSNLSVENMMEVLGGTAGTAYVSCAVHTTCGKPTIVPTSQLASCGCMYTETSLGCSQ